MRGYQKRIVYLKNTGSDIFEEAYFIIKEQTESSERAAPRLVEEANRIIDENVNFGIKKSRRINIKKILILGAGFIFEAAVIIALLLLIKL